jgi:hypothetical protein
LGSHSTKQARSGPEVVELQHSEDADNRPPIAEKAVDFVDGFIPGESVREESHDRNRQTDGDRDENGEAGAETQRSRAT